MLVLSLPYGSYLSSLYLYIKGEKKKREKTGKKTRDRLGIGA
jgi:hypothetical protein